MAKRVSPQEARDLVEKDGYVYVDVRSIPEFQAGHPAGAYNVPLMHLTGAGMSANPDFLDVMQKAFPREAKLVVGCKSGGRSAQAAAALERAGYTNVVDQRAGFEGPTNALTGGLAEPGWRPAGLPVSRQAEAGHDYEGVRAKAR